MIREDRAREVEFPHRYARVLVGMGAIRLSPLDVRLDAKVPVRKDHRKEYGRGLRNACVRRADQIVDMRRLQVVYYAYLLVVSAPLSRGRASRRMRYMAHAMVRRRNRVGRPPVPASFRGFAQRCRASSVPAMRRIRPTIAAFISGRARFQAPNDAVDGGALARNTQTGGASPTMGILRRSTAARGRPG